MGAVATDKSTQSKLKSNSSRGLPNWVSALVLLLVLMLGGWGLWRYFVGGSGQLSAASAASLTDANVVGPNIPRQPGQWQRPPNNGNNFGQFAARFAANLPDGIIVVNNGYLAKAGTIRVEFDSPNGNNPSGANWRSRFSYTTQDVTSPQEADILRAARLATTNAVAAAKAGVTADQIQQLRAIQIGNGLAVSTADRGSITALFRSWLAVAGRSATTAPSPATRPSQVLTSTPESKAAEQKLLGALAAIGNRQPRQTSAARAQRVQSILGDALLQKLKTGG
jgi:hypothetical protein